MSTGSMWGTEPAVLSGVGRAQAREPVVLGVSAGSWWCSGVWEPVVLMGQRPVVPGGAGAGSAHGSRAGSARSWEAGSPNG